MAVYLFEMAVVWDVPRYAEDADWPSPRYGSEPLGQPDEPIVDIVELAGVVVAACTLPKEKQLAASVVGHGFPDYEIEAFVLHVRWGRVIWHAEFW